MRENRRSPGPVTRRKIPEARIRELEFEYDHTVLEDGTREIDVIRPLEDSGFQINVVLVNEDGTMVFDSVSLSSENGEELDVGGPNGGAINQEMAEVTMWEAIEYTRHWSAYTYGRTPSAARGGKRRVKLSPESEAFVPH